MTVFAAYIREARWVRRAYAEPRRKFHRAVVCLPRWLHGFLDFPKTRLEA